jgi:hypothetical protein
MTEPLITIRVDDGKLREVQAIVGRIRGGTGRVFSRAINRTMSSARVHIAREISQGLKLGVRRVQSRIYLRRATRANLTGFLGLGTAGYDLARDFGAVDTRPTGTLGSWLLRYGGGGGVRVQVIRGQKTILPRAFIMTHGAEKKYWWAYGKVVTRKPISGAVPRWDNAVSWGKLVGRLPVMKVVGPSLAELWVQAPDMVARAISYSRHTLAKNIDDQVKLLLKESFDPGI